MKNIDKKNIFSVKNKVVIITGSSQGNGLEILKGFLSHGAKVCGIDIMQPKTKELISNKKFKFIQCNLQDEPEIIEATRKIKEIYSNIDVLINNAGISISSNSISSKSSDWDATHAINLKAPYVLSNMLRPIMPKGSSIINITSLGSIMGFPENPSYTSSKGGLRILSKSLSLDYAKYGIRVNNVLPGYIKTAMTSKSYSNKSMKSKRDARISLSRWGKSEDLVGPCIFLASDASNYITGTDIVVDGGWSSKGL